MIEELPDSVTVAHNALDIVVHVRIVIGQLKLVSVAQWRLHRFCKAVYNTVGSSPTAGFQ